MDLEPTNKEARNRNTIGETTRSDDRIPRRFRRSINGPTTLPEIPDDLVLEILVLLPVKSLLRFKCVSKAWLATISGQPFIAAHLQRSVSNHWRRPSFLIAPYLLDLWPHKISNIIRFYEWHHEATAGANLVHARDFRGRFGWAYRLAHCDGLVLLPTDKKLYVLNPATRELLTLPESIRRVHDPSSFCRGTVGFGRDPSTNKYKVVQCFRHRSSDDGLMGYYITGMQVFTIDSSTSSASWRDAIPPCSVDSPGNATFFKGSLFWLRRERDRLLRFCLRTETFSFIVHPPCPPRPPWLSHQNFSLSELDGELCLAHYGSSQLAIWTNKDGMNPQWHRRYVLNVKPCFAMAILPYGVLLKKYDDTIVEYNFGNKKMEDVASLESLRYHGPGTKTLEYKKGENLYSLDIIPYTQSLVSLTNAR